MNHLIRPGALLAGVVLLILVVPRVVPTPDILDAYGFYSGTGEENVEEWASLPVQYVGSDFCGICHQQEHKLWESSDHQSVSCEDCHGPGRAHLDDACRMCHQKEYELWEVTDHRAVNCEDCHESRIDVAPEDTHTPVIDRARGFCGQCHDKLVSRPALFPQVDMDVMGGGEQCIVCHSPHDPRAGMPIEVPHTLERHSDCQSCHVTHSPWVTEPRQVPHSLEERANCLECHGPDEVRGANLPRIPAGLERSDCFLCHEHEAGLVGSLPEDHAGRTATTCTNCHKSAWIEK